MNTVQLELDLLTPKTFEQLIKEHRFERISIELSPRLKRGWRIRKHGFPAKATLCVPSLFENSPEAIKLTLLQWGDLFLHASPKKFKASKKSLETIIWNYLATQQPQQSLHRPLNTERVVAKEVGKHYNLRTIFNTLNHHYFNDTLVSYLRFGQPATLTSYQIDKIDKAGRSVSLITIGGVYDSPEVPAFAIEGVMYHEMLHIALPPEKRTLRRLVHGKTFREAEKKFEYYEQWRFWEKNNIRKIQRKLKRAL